MLFQAPLDRGYLDSMSAERLSFSAQSLREMSAEVRCYVVDGSGRVGVDREGRLAQGTFSESADVWLLGRTVDKVIHCAVWLGGSNTPSDFHTNAVTDKSSLSPEAMAASGWETDSWENVNFVSLTEVGAELPDDEALIGAQAVALAKWHADTRFCSRCGERVIPTEAGWATTCRDCGHVEYPRTDPAIIVLITDAQDRILLGHNAAWPDSTMSLTAGFIEAGETPNRTVAREAYEELGIRISQVRYVGAQPWPGPRSLMLAYTAMIDEPSFVTSASGVVHHAPKEPEVKPDGVEIDYAKFFTRDEYRDALTSGTVKAPRRASIAHAMLVQWFGGPLPEPV